MRELSALIIILIGIVICFALSYYVIRHESSTKRKQILNFSQLFILIFLWKIGTYFYVDRLQIVSSEYYILIPIAVVGLLTHLINNNGGYLKDKTVPN